MKTRITRVLQHKGHDVRTVPIGSPVVDAARKMAELKIGSLLLTADGQAVGIVTERDLAPRVCRGGVDLGSTPVER